MNNELKQLIELDTLILNTSVEDLMKDSDLKFLNGWQNGSLGGFESNLAKTISVADGSNIIKLYRGFQAKVLAMRAYQIKDGFWDQVMDQVIENYLASSND